jgi:hypothetical protein
MAVGKATASSPRATFGKPAIKMMKNRIIITLPAGRMTVGGIPKIFTGNWGAWRT